MNRKDYASVVERIWKNEVQNERKISIKDAEDNLRLLWKAEAPFIKHAEFKAEKEYRLVFNKEYWQNDKYKYKIHYRKDQNILKPYLDIECEGGWPVREIIVGPGSNQSSVFRCVVHFLNNADLKVKGCSLLEQCEEYFKLCGNMPDEAQKIWDVKKKELANVKGNQLAAFDTIRNEILEKLENLERNHLFARQMREREITKEGIIVSKSAIPYVFHN